MNECGEDAFCESFKENHITSNGNWTVGKFAFGLPTHTNALEVNHHHKVKMQLLALLRRAKAHARFPAPIMTVIDACFESLTPTLSRETVPPSFVRA